MSQMRVAVIVPVFNRAGLVVDALASIAAQTRLPDRVIVVDDGSTDGSFDQVAQWVAAQPQHLPVELIRQQNLGAALARNRGAAQAKDCDLLAFLDSDDQWPADYLARMTAAMAADVELVAASCDQVLSDAATGSLAFVDQSRCEGCITESLLEQHIPPMPSATVVRASHFHALGGFDARYPISQDRHFFMRLSLRGPWRFVPGQPVTYRRNEPDHHCGASQLTERFWACDEREAWWRMAERFVLEEGGQQKVAAGPWRQRAARQWVEMGRRRVRRRQLAEAIACFEHATSLDKGNRAALRLTRRTRLRHWWARRLEQRGPMHKQAPLPPQPRIVVVVPVFNRGPLIDEALDSIAAQTRPADKLIVVDDGSTDDTGPRAAAWIEGHRGALDAVLITQPNAGAGAARHRGVQAAGPCDLLAFLDSDDLWPRDYLARAVDALRREPDAVAVQFDLRFIDLSSGGVRHFDQSLFRGRMTRLLYDLLWCQTRSDDRFEGQPPPIPSATVIRAQAYAQAGGFDLTRRLRADIDLDLRLSLLGPWAHAAGEPVNYRQHVDAAYCAAPQMSMRLIDIHQRLAGWRLLADFLLVHGRAGPLPITQLRQRLMRETRGAGQALERSGQLHAAAQCFAIAAEVAPWFRWRLRRKLRGLAGASIPGGPAKPAAPNGPTAPAASAATPPPSTSAAPASPAFNALDHFHKLRDARLDKQWGVFVIPIDSQHNDTLGGAPFRQQNVYLGRYAMPYKTIEGWFGYWDILDAAAASAEDGGQFVELGAAWGCATVYLASKLKLAGKRTRHVAIDRWPLDTDFEKFKENLRLAQVHRRVLPMRMSFDQASRHFEDASLDFIFVDGGHDYEDVKQDITHWWPKLKLGGTMAGDDWCDAWPGVEQAVRELLPHAVFHPTHFWSARKA